MQWREIWGRWWPEAKTKGEGVPLTDRQRKLAGYLLVLVIGAASFLHFTGNRTSPVVSSGIKEGQGHLNVESAAAKIAPRQTGFEEDVERKLAVILAQIEGVGSTEVMVSVITGSRLELAHDVSKDRTITEETDKQGGQRRITAEHAQEKVVILREGQSSGDRPVVLAEHRPTIGGVLVVAEGAKDPSIKLQIARAVATAIDIPAHRVEVVARKK